MDFAEPPLAQSVDGVLRELQMRSGAPALATLSAGQLMGERAKLGALTYGNSRSAGRSCRLLPVAGATLAINLPRPEDWELIPAWLEAAPNAVQTWQQIAEHIANRPSLPLLQRARELGIAAASTEPAHCVAGTLPTIPNVTRTRRTNAPRVIDLSGLWAGPLCGHLLHLCGAEVIKVESTHRPDGARLGNADFYDLLNQGKRCVSLDLSQPRGAQTLTNLLCQADIVIDAARPRALQQMQIDISRLLDTNAHLTWLSITGHGRDDPSAGWIAFGDDAGVAAGLSDIMRRATGHYQFAGDAIADPITGIHAALAAWRSWLAGGSRLISLPLTEVTAAVLEQEVQHRGLDQVIATFARWWHQATSDDPYRGIQPRYAAAPAAPLGADTHRVLTELGVTC